MIFFLLRIRGSLNMTHYFPTKALVQCKNHAQPECMRVKAPTWHGRRPKRRFYVWNFALKNNPRWCSKSEQSNKPRRTKYTTSCFQTTSTQQVLTHPPESLRTSCEGTNTNTSRVHQLQSWLSWFAAENALTEKAWREPTHNVKRPERLHTRCDKYN